MCNCGEVNIMDGIEEHSDRVEALRQAVIHCRGLHYTDAVKAAADFYDFLSGDISNVDKLAAIAAILADD